MFCFRLSFFPRGGGPGDRAGQPGRVGVGPGNRAGWIASGRAGQPSLQLAVRTGEPTCGSTGTPTGGSTGTTAEAKFGPSNRWFNRPYNRSKVRSFNSPPTDAKFGPSTGGSTVPTAKAKFGPSTAPPTDAKSGLQPLLRPTQSSALQPVVQPSLQPTQSPVLQPLLQPTLPTVMPMHLNRSRRQCNEIPEEQHRQSSKIYVKLHIFIRKAKLSST